MERSKEEEGLGRGKEEGSGVPGSPELGCKELEGQAEVEEEEFFYDSLTVGWMVLLSFYDCSWVYDLTELPR